MAGLGGLGGKGVGSGGPYTLQPAVTFGKGFGDLPDRLKWLRPFAIWSDCSRISDQWKNEDATLRSEHRSVAVWVRVQLGHRSLGVRA
jgi:hypothetical protein